MSATWRRAPPGPPDRGLEEVRELVPEPVLDTRAESLGRRAGNRTRDVWAEQSFLEELCGGGAPRHHRGLVVAVERPGVEVHRPEDDGVIGDHDLRVHDCSRVLPD